MTATDTEAALLAAVIADPGDDLCRLVLADWWEEHGRPEWAEFVRVSVEVGRVWADTPRGAAFLERFGTLCQRERDLLLRSRLAVYLPSGDQIETERLVARVGAADQPAWVVRRGFVAEVRCDLRSWIAHGPAAVRAHPVETVRITDREPFGHTTELLSWRSEGDSDWPEVIPAAVFRHLPLLPSSFAEYFPSSEAAHAALSAACLGWAKAASPGP